MHVLNLIATGIGWVILAGAGALGALLVTGGVGMLWEAIWPPKPDWEGDLP